MNEDSILAVKRGAYFLDGQFPNWATSINLDKLEMDDCEQCIIGQAVGNYGIAIAEAAGCQPYTQSSNQWAVEHGFDVPDSVWIEDHDYETTPHEAYKELETLWTEQVRDRLG